ncbi:hypothetical protein T06_3514 [Trichinella sp. T6]|nr:hypothetical protein T06_3514 [Trichinella sp. T6]
MAGFEHHHVHFQERMKNKPHEFTAVISEPAKSENF